MELSSVLRDARSVLQEVTPLKTDCGRLCGGACCQPSTEETQGMLLFPGEEAFYEGLTGYRMVDCAAGRLLVCTGRCRREERPLSCRMFPLLPLVREDGIRVAMDRRGRSVCPLTHQGKAALNPAFVEAVGACGRILMTDDTQAAFLRKLTCEQDEWKRLAQALGAEK